MHTFQFHIKKRLWLACILLFPHFLGIVLFIFIFNKLKGHMAIDHLHNIWHRNDETLPLASHRKWQEAALLVPQATDAIWWSWRYRGRTDLNTASPWPRDARHQALCGHPLFTVVCMSSVSGGALVFRCPLGACNLLGWSFCGHSSSGQEVLSACDLLVCCGHGFRGLIGRGRWVSNGCPVSKFTGSNSDLARVLSGRMPGLWKTYMSLAHPTVSATIWFLILSA